MLAFCARSTGCICVHLLLAFNVPDVADMLMQVGYKVVDHRTHMAQQDTLLLQVFKKPFASGGCRMAFYAQDSNGVRSAAAVEVSSILHAAMDAALTCLPTEHLQTGHQMCHLLDASGVATAKLLRQEDVSQL